MQTTNYKGFVVTLSDEDTKKIDKEWKGIARKHWRCIVYDKPNRKQMGFDVFGVSSHATMKPLEALYKFCDDAYTYSRFDDAEDLMREYGYPYAVAKKVYDSLGKAYFKARKFIGSDSDILEIVNELREEWG